MVYKNIPSVMKTALSMFNPTQENIDKLVKAKLIDSCDVLWLHNCIEILSDVYPNQWCIQLSDQGTIENKFFKFAFCVIVHFPEITITNSNKRSHKIHDIYVKVKLFPQSEVKLQINMSGLREKLTIDELTSNYSHSHLPGLITKAKPEFENFCLGAYSDFSKLVMMMAGKCDKNLLKMFFINLKLYLEWESLEGTPHKHISDIIDKSATVSLSDSVIYYYYDVASTMFMFYSTDKIDFRLDIDNKGKIRIADFDEQECAITKLVYHHSLSRGIGFNKFIFYKSSDGIYYTIDAKTKLSVGINQHPFIFKREKIVRQIIDSKNILDLNTDMYLHPNIKNYAIKYLENKLNKASIGQSISNSIA